ncbi:MAG TPA: UbiA-like polyprenyltransferase [Candidatus Polarisedimenticolaceae bacterium]
MTVGRTIVTWGRLVKFSHSVFALPFALSGATLAASRHGITPGKVLWIVVAMIGARNAAMGFNRLVDQAIDARNPRTATRELPAGALSRVSVWMATLALTGIFLLACFMLNPLCLAISPVAIVVIFGYSFTKRFTWGSHLVLGLALAIAPVGGWVAVAGTFDPIAWLLAAAVLFWVAGFDTVYACQDVEFDRASGLHSIPARFGLAGALNLARLFHAAALGLLAAVGVVAGLHPLYWPGMAAIAGLVVWQHRLLHPEDLSRLGMAFFNANGTISVVYFAVVLVCVWLA